ncbi:MAG TPA: YcnI family protein [Pseudolysinimonas sp.]|nr:YcnI family protein [Pseudolysinimonas sp.]
MKNTRTRILTAATTVVAGTALALALPLSASAHVTINTTQADPGSYPLVNFQVPTESATATTTAIDITLPEKTPFGSVSTVPVPGWTAQLVTEPLKTPIKTDDGSVTEAVTHVIWTAAPGHELTAAQYGVFPVLLGGVPNTGKVVLAVAQSYSDGTVVNWNGTKPDSEFPAPVLYVNDKPAGEHHGAADDDHATATVVDDKTPASDDVLARVLGITGLVVGAVAVVIAVTSRRRVQG